MNLNTPNPVRAASLAARTFIGVIGLVFAAIGVVVIVFLWAEPSGEFGSPPLFFRLFGSLVGVAFVAFGGFTFASMLMARRVAGSLRGLARRREAPPHRDDGDLSCPNCGAPLGSGSVVAPSGDVDCEFCDSRFNVRRADG